MEKKYPKSVFKLFFKLNSITKISGLSDEILCILEGQETAKLLKVKVGGKKTRLKRLSDLAAR